MFQTTNQNMKTISLSEHKNCEPHPKWEHIGGPDFWSFFTTMSTVDIQTFDVCMMFRDTCSHGLTRCGVSFSLEMGRVRYCVPHFRTNIPEHIPIIRRFTLVDSLILYLKTAPVKQQWLFQGCLQPRSCRWKRPQQRSAFVSKGTWW